MFAFAVETSVLFLVAEAAELAGRTLANVGVETGVTRGAVSTSRRQTVVDLLLAHSTRVTHRTQAGEIAGRRGQTRGAVLARLARAHVLHEFAVFAFKSRWTLTHISRCPNIKIFTNEELILKNWFSSKVNKIQKFLNYLVKIHHIV